MVQVLSVMYVDDFAFPVDIPMMNHIIVLIHCSEQLQLVPDKLEARISEKRFLTAVDILQDALRMIRKTEMEGIGALNDLRVYLSNQEHGCIVSLSN